MICLVEKSQDSAEDLSNRSDKSSDQLRSRDPSVSMTRVLVLGCPGSGKSTFSERMGRESGLPVIHLDAHYWTPGWVCRSEPEWAVILRELVAQERYVMDGNYSKTLELRLQRADTVFFFDLPRRICLYRVVKRWIMNWGRTRADMAEGCPEKLDLAFIGWVWRFNQRNRPKILQLLGEVEKEKRVVVFRHPREVQAYWLSRSL